MAVLTSSALEAKTYPRKHRTVWRFVKKLFQAQVGSRSSEGGLRRESFYLSTGSLERRRPSELSVVTVLTLLEEPDGRG